MWNLRPSLGDGGLAVSDCELHVHNRRFWMTLVQAAGRGLSLPPLPLLMSCWQELALRGG